MRRRKRIYPVLQVPIKAGHEFIVSTEEKYSKIGDDKVLYMDYVRSILHFYITVSLTIALPQKNLPKVTAPGKLIYVDDGWFYIVSE